MTRLRNILAHLRVQLWLLPALITALAGGLAYLMIEYGAALFSGVESDVWWLYSGGPDSARDLLSSFLSGMMTMTSLVVSITFVILTLAASQLGPRLISMFVADRQIQAVLGLFLGTILYVIIVLRTLDETLGEHGVPHAAVTLASVLTVACLFALLFYIHKITRSLVADNVVAAVGQNLENDLREILRDEAAGAPAHVDLEGGPVWPLALRTSGYIQVVNYSRLVDIAQRNDAIFEIKVRAGHFLLSSGEHVRVHGPRLSEECEAEIRNAFVIGSSRTPAQDIEHGIRQLVEIALRALSPGINDTFTAIAVIDRLGAALEQIFTRALQPSVLKDEDGVVRVVALRSDAPGLVDASFDPIRQSGAGVPAVLIRIADVLGQLAPVLDADDASDAVLEQLAKLAESARLGGLAARDLDDVLRRIAEAQAAIVSPNLTMPLTSAHA